MSALHRHAIEWTLWYLQQDAGMPSSTRLSEWVLTISDRRHGHAKQVCRGDPCCLDEVDLKSNIQVSVMKCLKFESQC
jgi:hypothetical protein